MGGGSFFPPLAFMIRGLTEEISYFEGEPQESLALPRFVCVSFSSSVYEANGPCFLLHKEQIGLIFSFFIHPPPQKKITRHEARLKKK